MKKLEANEYQRATRAPISGSERQARKCSDAEIAFSRELNRRRLGLSVVRQVCDLIEWDIACDAGPARYATHRTYG